MSIPLDRLYQFVDRVAGSVPGAPVVIYRYVPDGSKNLKDLDILYSYTEKDRLCLPQIYCHDQEPLNYELNQVSVPIEQVPCNHLKEFYKLLDKHGIKQRLNVRQHINIWDKCLLLHSEQRSMEVEKYQHDQYIPVYYWSHAIIARDWFRYAEYVTQRKQVNKTFLIYSRAWSGTREYRLRFAELLVRLGLQDHCQTSINSIEPELGIHYKLHDFKNPVWRPEMVLEDYFQISTAHSHYSADFDIEDYQATEIEVVLETLFDDDRLHLTEKSLRPIACGQPFILAGTQGSLEYLRSYGFKTFGDIWDERYDLVEDPEERLVRITDLMRHIANWAPDVREQKMAKAKAIAEYNRQRFFSQEFFNQTINELKTNLKSGFDDLKLCDNYITWITQWKKLITHPEVITFLNTNKDHKQPTTSQIDFIMSLAQAKLAEKNTP
jgi:hypothetical protein